jgi:hypothetical protein
MFLQADRRHSSGLLGFIEDRLSLKIGFGDEVLINVFRELYYPASPYAFSVVDSAILGEICDRSLAKQIGIARGRATGAISLASAGRCQPENSSWGFTVTRSWSEET